MQSMADYYQSAVNTATSIGLTVGDALTPVLSVSAFLDKGVLTPEEFVIAGNKLVKLCPTWRWEKGEPGNVRSYLPPDKQFLSTPRLPCLQRVKLMEEQGDLLAQTEAEDEDGWLATADTSVGAGSGSGKHEIALMEDAEPEPECGGDGVATVALGMGGLIINEDYMGGSGGGGAAVAVAAPAAAAPALGGDDFGLDDYVDESLEGDDEATLVVSRDAATDGAYMVRSDEPDEAFQRERRYDLDITYDKYYQTPRVWLFGYDEENNPLGPDQIFEDISQDHANRTVTLEGHPHKSLIHATIHPCKHAATMKKMIDQLMEGGRKCEVDEYMFLFLKFIACVIPTMEYDYTLEADFR